MAGFAGLQQAPPGVGYHRVLAGPQSTVVRSMTGVLAAIVVFVVLVPLATQGFIWIAWLLAGSPGDFTSFYTAGTAFETPGGMTGVHLGIALLAVIAALSVALVHQTSPRWLISVEPGVRWRYLLIVTVVAIIVLNGVLWLSRWNQPWDPHSRPDMWAFLVVIVLTSPLQALGEEVFFRGYLLQAFGSLVRTPWFAITTSALVFALFHGTQNLPLFLDRFAFGMLAGVLTVATGGLEAAVAAHVVNNLFAFGYAAVESSVAQVKAVQQIGWVDAAFDVGGFAVYALVALVIARRLTVSTRTPSAAARPV
ncbi:CPBP family intramembrane glutamic endopeptidase [Propionicicella superfundia]|uniref:CPBP family intramembrane glutamic endopeptidase n=1 Tax=Propionicicella superfundia TaxID=348582 RepID=UPI00041C5E9E|nr:CPBP family intramembrane glutamic endopeptidase [Propionicicella superfundia]